MSERINWYAMVMHLASAGPDVLDLINSMREAGRTWMQIYCLFVIWDKSWRASDE